MTSQQVGLVPGAATAQGTAEVATQRLMLGQVKERDAYSRSTGAGETRLNVEASQLLLQVGQAHSQENFFHWVAVHEGRNSESFYLTPTDENDPHRLPLGWRRAAKVATFSLRKVLIAKQIRVPKGHALVCQCNPTELQGAGAALELRFGERTVVPVVAKGPRKPKPHTTPTAPLQPTETR